MTRILLGWKRERSRTGHGTGPDRCTKAPQGGQSLAWHSRIAAPLTTREPRPMRITPASDFGPLEPKLNFSPAPYPPAAHREAAATRSYGCSGGNAPLASRV